MKYIVHRYTHVDVNRGFHVKFVSNISLRLIHIVRYDGHDMVVYRHRNTKPAYITTYGLKHYKLCDAFHKHNGPAIISTRTTAYYTYGTRVRKHAV